MDIFLEDNRYNITE